MTIEVQTGELRAREERLDLEPSQAHLHVLRLAAYAHVTEADLLARFGGLMNAKEKEKQRRYVFEKGRREYLMTRALVRTTLSRYADVAPTAWEFQENAWGRPSVVAPTVRPLHFNLSNTEGCVVCLVALDREIGVDIEWLTRTGETVEIADRFFSPREARDLRALPIEAQRDRFFSLWTLKESYIKARGMGLALPLDQFSFLLDAAGQVDIGFATEPSLNDDASSWQFAQHRLGAEHLAATAVRLRDGGGLSIVRIDASVSPALSP